MLTKKFTFTLSTKYVGSDHSEEVEFEFDEDATQDDIDNQVSESYERWVLEHNCGNWVEIE